jgi:hypothetical protein
VAVDPSPAVDVEPSPAVAPSELVGSVVSPLDVSVWVESPTAVWSVPAVEVSTDGSLVGSSVVTVPFGSVVVEPVSAAVTSESTVVATVATASVSAASVSASARADAAAASQKSVIPKTTVAHRPEARRETLSRKPKLTPSLKASPPRASQVGPTEAVFLPSHARLVKVVRDFSVPPQSSRKRPEIAADLVERSTRPT